MTSLTRIPTTRQIRQLEAQWIEQCGNSWGQVLMEIAGRATSYRVLEIWKESQGEVAVVCGRGNNGGDGLVIARYLKLWGVPVTVFIVPSSKSKDLAMTTPESDTNRRILEKLAVEIQVAPTGGAELSDAFASASVIVDALLGTGLDRPLEGAYREIVDAINGSGNTVVAVDIPSGINSDTGEVMPACVWADCTITFGYLKPGLLSYPGAQYVGELSVVDIGLPELESQEPSIHLITADLVQDLLPLRLSNSHKGSFGTLLTVAGSLGMSGASILASETGLRAGAGLSLLATPRSLVTALPSKEVIYHALPETDELSIAAEALAAVSEKLEKATAVVFGPGLSTHESTVRFVHRFVSELLGKAERCCIIDADALNAISRDVKVLPADSRHIVITPHPKELSRLTGETVEEIQRDRVSAAQRAAERFNCVVVLKGARTIVAGPDQKVYINPTGNAGMATAGAGDVLSGIIGGLLAQGLSALDAAVAGVYLHGTAGDIASEELGEAGMVAGDIADHVPDAIKAVESGAMSSLEWQLFEGD